MLVTLVTTLRQEWNNSKRRHGNEGFCPGRSTGFAQRNKFADYWKSEIAFAANLLAATSGMRLGEVVAIRVQDIRDGFVVVEHSWIARAD